MNSFSAVDVQQQQQQNLSPTLQLCGDPLGLQKQQQQQQQQQPACVQNFSGPVGVQQQQAYQQLFPVGVQIPQQQPALNVTEQEDVNLFELGRDIKAEPTIFEGTLRVDIRQWDKVSGARTTKGISLPAQCWIEVLNGCQHINSAVKQMKAKHPVNAWLHLGNLVYISVKDPYWMIDIRYWYQAQDGTIKPTRRGISLKFHEFNKLMGHADEIGKKLEGIQNNI